MVANQTSKLVIKILTPKNTFKDMKKKINKKVYWMHEV